MIVLCTVPSTPREFKVEAVPDVHDSLSASWRVPEFPNGIISGYVVTCHSLSESTHRYSFDSSITFAILSDLTPDTGYDCTIQARTHAGDGISSELLHVRTTIKGELKFH